jgi:ADP-ribose pyrophosphatase YjhB (NUDIX family)
MEDRWLTLAKRLQAIASTGCHFAQDPFDQERYQQVAAIANEMLANIGSTPIVRIQALVSEFAMGYATPKVDVRGAIVRDDKVLMVRERADGLWTLPGGYADVGLSPRENVIKEVREETGLHVEVAGMYAVRHKAKHEYDPDARDFYKMFFICQPLDDADPQPSGVETTEVGFFGLHELPPLSRGRVIEKDIVAAMDYLMTGGQAALCD